ncbi:MAG TPA: hypothetical protein DHV26_08130 [Cytophagales bacterium]|nr:hypothetical protein [Cytophagales bacterium]HRG07715.1 hypothetical protein [Cyclobacteriaceae bacterium]
MKRTILIPTDFSIESLNLFKYAAQQAQEPLNIVLVHGQHLSDSIFDLLFRTRKDSVSKLSNPDFEDACRILRNKYASRINSFRIEIFSGVTQSAFQNFLEGNRITEILIPKTYKLQVSGKSFDVLPYLRASSLAPQEVEWKPIENAPERNQLAEIFLT